MLLKQVLQEVESAIHPVAKALHKGEQFKVLALAFKKGMVLKAHQAHFPTKLFVLTGEVIYKQDDRYTTLSALDEIEIPVAILHSVEAIEDSLCLLTQG